MNTKFLPIILVLIVLFGSSACQQTSTATNANVKSATVTLPPATSPTEAFKQLFAAVKSQNTEQIKATMSKATQQFAEGAAQTSKISLAQQLRNGLIQSTISAQLPPMRDERIKDDFGALEVQTPAGTWEDVWFIKEDGGWKLAVGDAFKGTYKQPGRPQSSFNSNTAQPTMLPANSANPTLNSNLKNLVEQPAAKSDKANEKK